MCEWRGLPADRLKGIAAVHIRRVSERLQGSQTIAYRVVIFLQNKEVVILDGFPFGHRAEGRLKNLRLLSKSIFVVFRGSQRTLLVIRKALNGSLSKTTEVLS